MRADLHPVLSGSLGLCPACGGAGVRPRAAAEIAAAAKESKRPVPLPAYDESY